MLVDYHSMLRSIEAALKSCETSHGVKDQFHRSICEDLQQERERLLRLIARSHSSPADSVTTDTVKSDGVFR